MGRSSALTAVLSSALLLLFAAGCNSTGKSGSLTGVVGSEGWDADFEVRLGIPPAEAPEFGQAPELSIEEGSGNGEYHLIADGEDTRAVFATVSYNPEVCHFVGVYAADSSKSIFTAIEVEPGNIHFGWIIPHADKKTGLSGKLPVVTFKFLPGQSSENRLISTAPSGAQHSVGNLESEWSEAGIVATFFERNPGDYDRSGEVGIPDLVPIAINFQASVSDYEGDPLAAIDGDGNGEIGISDITVIAQNYMRTISGYSVQFSVDGGSSWIPQDFSGIHFEDSQGFLRGTAEVEIVQSKAFPEWKIVISPENIGALGIPGLEPTSSGLKMRVFPSDGAIVGAESNPAEIQIAVSRDNEPPVWDSTARVTAVLPVANTNALTVTFGKASDNSAAPVQYRVYYAKAADFSLDEIGEFPMGTDTIRMKKAEFSAPAEPPYSVMLKGLVPGEIYSVAVRAFDKAFPVQNFEENSVVISAAVSANGLFVGPMEMNTFMGFPYEFNPDSGDPIHLSAIVSGGDGVYEAVWNDFRPNTGFFFGHSLVSGPGGAESVVSSNWGTGSGDEKYLIELTVTDGAGRTGIQERQIRVNRGANTNFGMHVWPIIEAKCASCHTGDTAGGLDLSNPLDAYSNLVGVNSTAMPSKKLVKPFDPQNSYLMSTVYGGVAGERVGERMPPGETPLEAQEITQLLRWIITGAAQGNTAGSIALGDPALLVVNPSTLEASEVDAIPVGAFGRIDIPVLTQVSPPLSISVSTSENALGDVWFDLEDVFSDGTITLFTGGKDATKFTVEVEVEDEAGKVGSASIDVEISKAGEDASVISYSSGLETLISANCASCHTNAAPVLSQGSGYANMVNASSSISGWDYAEPGFPSKSYMINKMMGWPPSGEKAHHFDKNSSDDMRLLVKSAMWIYGGAKP